MTVLNDPARTASTGAVSPVVPTASRFRPLGLDEVHLTTGFWADRQRTNADGTLPHIEHWLEREGWLKNFDLAAESGPSGEALARGRRGREFSDSEVYKYLEALAWEIGRADDPNLEARFRAVVDRIAAAQQIDGYLGTRFGRRGQKPRWSDLEWGHELYCAGHLFQAAVARARTRPMAGDGLLAIAVRFADLICLTFADGAVERVCGHAEVETGLVELARVTGNQRYLEQARLFVERRGTGTLQDIEWGRSYYQDDVPVREAHVLRGHAVRANYLAAGAVDVAVDTGDEALLDALRTQWRHTVAARTYITGGQGAHHQDEAFGDDWELPPDRAYSETCAGIASVQFAWRLLLQDGDADYADLIERTLYNVVATSPADDGRAFYYSNTLQRRVPGAPANLEQASPRAEASLRAPWFEVSCCPPNVARTLASLASYIATADGDGIQLHQYTSSQISTKLPNGDQVDLDIVTAYPTEGEISITVRSDASEPWTLSLRVPNWATGATVRINGEVHDGDAAAGTTHITRQFRRGDEVILELPMVPRFTHPDARIDAVRGSVAVEYGPSVLALESTDLLGTDVIDAVLDVGHELAVVEGAVVAQIALRSGTTAPWPYGESDEAKSNPSRPTQLVPYRDWAKRGPSTMRVWIPTS